MATTVLLSQHSSNPLEVSSSDARNTNYRTQYLEARRQNVPLSSDDPTNGYNTPEMVRYRTHLSKMFPGMQAASAQKRKPPARNKVVDLDSDMDSEGEISAQYDDMEEDESGDEDAVGDTDEEMTLYLKPREEREEIEEQIADLEETVPTLRDDYKIVDRLGTGTFSAVYKAIDLGYHTKWDNTPWHGFHPPSSSAYYQSAMRLPDNKVFVAIKRIYVTSSPDRIRNEISIMEECRGCRHVSQLITAFRENDQVVAVMPYQRNEDFREFYHALSMSGIKAYFRCMFRALRDVHSRGIIHRDVKPANFLFDPRTGIGTLCDFGLACRMESASKRSCLHTPPTREYPHGRHLQRNEFDVEHLKLMQRESRTKSSMPSDKVGYPDKDTRPHSKANRAGTRGFRAPEVLLKCGEQTGAIDIWSTGMILAFFLTGKFPLFSSSDDIEALMEIAAIIGRRKMERVATLHRRTFITNVPDISSEGISWRVFVERQNPELRTPPKPDPRYYPHNNPQAQISFDLHLPPPSSSSSSASFPSHSRSPSPSALPPLITPSPEEHSADVDAALDLLEQLMNPESTRRITPRGALYHPFLADPDEPEDDEFFPHPFGEGVCGGEHLIDEETGELGVQIALPDGTLALRKVVTGQGIAIGRQPCEFHRSE